VRIRYRGRKRLHKVKYEESSEELFNPGCGWYHVYSFQAQPPLDGRPVKEEVWLDAACRKEQLALVLIDIGSFRSCDLSKEALIHIEEIMRFFHEEHKQMILRFAYDTRGDGVVKEPGNLHQVIRHMEQTKDVIRRFLADILVIQGIFVGSWGEMHGSRYLDSSSMQELIHTLYRITEGRCFLAVRTPAQWRQIVNCPGTEKGIQKRLALFNDGIFGSPTDMGTYGTADRTESGKYGRRSCEEELQWQETHMGGVPNGGEVLLGVPRIGYRQAAGRFQKMHLTYLNSIYQQEQLAFWKAETVKESGCWKGISGYDYIGRHLGYRFVIRNVLSKRDGHLEVTVSNCGFSSLTEEAECLLVMEEEGGRTVRRKIQVDARDWKNGQKTRFLIEFSPEACSCRRIRLFLRLERVFDRAVIRFANRGAGDQALLGEFGE
jgi:hypothetical protein